MIGSKQALVIACMAFVLAGCQTWSSLGWGSKSDKIAFFDYEGLPTREYLVGGGYRISYRARTEGDLYIADQHSRRLLATISLQPGEKHEIIYDVNDEKLARNLAALGIDPKKATIKVYFVPR